MYSYTPQSLTATAPLKGSHLCANHSSPNIHHNNLQEIYYYELRRPNPQARH